VLDLTEGAADTAMPGSQTESFTCRDNRLEHRIDLAAGGYDPGGGPAMILGLLLLAGAAAAAGEVPFEASRQGFADAAACKAFPRRPSRRRPRQGLRRRRGSPISSPPATFASTPCEPRATATGSRSSAASGRR
jgi:hypothetical protein